MSQNRERLLSVFEILKRDTNVDHPISSNRDHRKTGLQKEFDADRRGGIRRYPYPDRPGGRRICTYDGEYSKGYYLREREFEFSELRLLTDAVLVRKIYI